MSLGWEYNQHPGKPIDDYEFARSLVKRKKGALRLSGVARRIVLVDGFGVSVDDVVSAEAEAERVQKQRERTINRARFNRKIGVTAKRIFFGRKSGSCFKKTSVTAAATDKTASPSSSSFLVEAAREGYYHETKLR